MCGCTVKRCLSVVVPTDIGVGSVLQQQLENSLDRSQLDPLEEAVIVQQGDTFVGPEERRVARHIVQVRVIGRASCRERVSGDV